MIAVEPMACYDNDSSLEPREQSDMFAMPGTRVKKVSFRFFLVVDLCLVWASAGIASLIQLTCTQGTHNPRWQEFIGLVPLDLLFLFSVFVTLFAHTQGLYEFPSKRSYRDDLKVLAETITGSAIIVGAGAYLGGSRISVGPLVLTLIVTWIVTAAWRKVVRCPSIPRIPR